MSRDETDGCTDVAAGGGDPRECVVVVGSGPCGAVAARQLLAAGRSVLLLDAGTRPVRGAFLHVAGRTVVRLSERRQLTPDRAGSHSVGPATWFSSLSLGGLSNYWTGAVPRFEPEDFEIGATVDERFRWPLGYDELAPWYAEVEPLLTITAGDTHRTVPAGTAAHRWRQPADWREMAAAARAAGHDLAPLPIAKAGPWTVALRPREFTSYHNVLRPLLDHPSFMLVRGARVTRILADGDRARGVVWIGTDGRRHVASCAAVVLAAGTVDTVEILLRSRSADHPTGLGNHHDLLGRYVHDHPREWWPVTLTRPLTALVNPMFLGRGERDQRAPLATSAMTFGVRDLRHRVATLANRRVDGLGVQVFGTMVPDHARSIALLDTHPDDDALDAPASRVRFALSYDDAAVATVHAARERFVELCRDVGNPARIGPFHDLTPGQSVHVGGGARMHADPRFGVVDGTGRVHGVDNVAVADMSVLPTCPEKHPTLTAMALAARAAAALADDHA